jgi:hypothetical protein
MIITVLKNHAGFYSELFFLLNHYLHIKKTHSSYKVLSHKWLFKYKLGWEDYFKNIDVIGNYYHEHYEYRMYGETWYDSLSPIHIHMHTYDNNQNIRTFNHLYAIGQFSMYDYKNAIKEVYVYNDTIREIIENTKKNLSLTNYSGIFIRRGDKLISRESNFIGSEKFIELLLIKKPDCKTIFLQTDDYNCYLEIKKYIEDKNLQINIVTLCKEDTKGGMIIFNYHQQKLNAEKDNNDTNNLYLLQSINDLNNYKPVNTMNNEEIYQHVIDMLTGIDILLNSDMVICDFSSNVSRFIKLAHNNSNNVLNIVNPEKDIDWDSVVCPGYDFYYK